MSAASAPQGARDLEVPGRRHFGEPRGKRRKTDGRLSCRGPNSRDSYGKDTTTGHLLAEGGLHAGANCLCLGCAEHDCLLRGRSPDTSDRRQVAIWLDTGAMSVAVAADARMAILLGDMPQTIPAAKLENPL